MSERSRPAMPVSQSWDTYWRDAEDGAAYTSGGVSHPAIQAFWSEFFSVAKVKFDAPRIIDIASGSGAVLESAQSSFGGKLPELTCLDISPSAIEKLEQRFPGIYTIVADARKIPLKSESYDIATSQFGIEYAGLEAMDEVARLVAPGGQLGLLLHNRAGSIFHECAASLDAIRRMQQARFIPYAIKMFENGFAAVGGADRAEYDAAAKRLAPAVRTLESIMTQYGTHVAGDTVARLYDDVATIHEGIQNYEASEVLDWLRRMEGELNAYAERMASMCDAAIDRDAIESLCEGFRAKGFTDVRAAALVEATRRPPLAWALIGNRD